MRVATRWRSCDLPQSNPPYYRVSAIRAISITNLDNIVWLNAFHERFQMRHAGSDHTDACDDLIADSR